MWFLLENHILDSKCFQVTVQVNCKKTGKMLLKEQMHLFYVNCDVSAFFSNSRHKWVI